MWENLTLFLWGFWCEFKNLTSHIGKLFVQEPHMIGTLCGSKCHEQSYIRQKGEYNGELWEG
jgi:hypothetical protein